MARKPYKYIIRLTEEEKKTLESLLRRGKTERRLADRARMILWSHNNVPIVEITRRLGCSEQIVLNWRREFLARREKEGPINALQDRHRSGRPPCFSPSAGSTGEGYCL